MTDFRSSYIQQKEAYYSALREAQQAPPDKQPELIQHVLDLNSELAKQVREYIASDPESPDLTAELKKIQKEFLRLQKEDDRKKTLDMILHEDRNKIKSLRWQFDILLLLLGLAIVTILYMIIRLGAQSMLSPVIPVPSTAMS
jgi:hypothetical protein